MYSHAGSAEAHPFPFVVVHDQVEIILGLCFRISQMPYNDDESIYRIRLDGLRDVQRNAIPALAGVEAEGIIWETLDSVGRRGRAYCHGSTLPPQNRAGSPNRIDVT
ncbi:MAG: hypothetical protein GTO22_03345 [Gemmatimonadales bacterium]|nr:hypothetical protein [Gemmatimonadales bacterium]